MMIRPGSESLPMASGSLRKPTLQAVRHSFGTQLSVFALSIASISLLSRWLAADDFGVFGLAFVTVTWVSCFTESGLSYATIQRADITESQASNLFWANLLLGLVACLSCGLLGPVVGWIFGRPEISSMMAALGLGLLIGCVGVQHLALLKRRLQYGRIAVVTIGSKVIGLTAALLMASRGAGAWSLVGQEVGLAMGRVLLVWMVCRWTPSLPQSGVGTLLLMRLGVVKSAADLLGIVRRSSDTFLLGLFYGTEVVGLYGRAVALVSTPLLQAVGPITNVAVPALSRVQAEPERFRRATRQGLQLIAFVALPACVFVGVAARPLVMVLLGPSWTDTVPIVQALTVRAAVATVFFPAVSWGFSALGNTGAQLRWSIFSLLVTLAIGAVGASFGGFGMAVAVGVASAVVVPAGVSSAFKGTGLSLSEVCRGVVSVAVASVTAGLLAWTAVVAMSSISAFLSLAVAVPVFASTYLLCFAVHPGGRSQLRETFAVALGRP